MHANEAKMQRFKAKTIVNDDDSHAFRSKVIAKESNLQSLCRKTIVNQS
jgi:hypothetical protein